MLKHVLNIFKFEIRNQFVFNQISPIYIYIYTFRTKCMQMLLNVPPVYYTQINTWPTHDHNIISSNIVIITRNYFYYQFAAVVAD